jgi:hypothetical protein
VVKPVLDLANQRALDCYESSAGLEEALVLTRPFEVFPYGTLASRRADTDHTRPYVPPDEGGPPGQTALANLGPLGRSHHRAKTFGQFVCHQPLPGLYLWRAPTGSWYRVDHTGTTPLGTDVPEIIRQQYAQQSPLEAHLADLRWTLAA